MNIIAWRPALRVAALACALAGGNAWGDPWVWSETRTFQLDDVATAATRGYNEPMWTMTNSSQVRTFAFNGMPSTLSLAGKSYRLGSVQVLLDSTFDTSFTLYARDNFYAESIASGSADSWVRATLPAGGLQRPAVVHWEESVYDWCVFTCYAEKSTAFATPYDLDIAFTDTSAFTQLEGFNVLLGKYTTLVIDGDNNDREDAIRNDLSRWRGSLTIHYNYEDQAVTASVPEPATTSLLLSGGAALLLWARRRRPF